MAIKILLVDDHAIVREGMRLLIDREDDLQVTALAGTGADAVRLARECSPDLVIMDISMPGMDGIEATRIITAEASTVRVLALSMESERRFVVEVLKAGAHGYLLKEFAFAEIVTAIRTVAAGEAYLARRIADLLLKDFLQRIPSEGSLACDVLTRRERETLQLIADGKSSKEIAFAFGVSLKTVETQRMNVMKKLDLYSIAELTKYAVREGLNSLG